MSNPLQTNLLGKRVRVVTQASLVQNHVGEVVCVYLKEPDEMTSATTLVLTVVLRLDHTPEFYECPLMKCIPDYETRTGKEQA